MCTVSICLFDNKMHLLFPLYNYVMNVCKFPLAVWSSFLLLSSLKVSKGPNLTQDTNGKVTHSQLYTTNESQEFSHFPAGDHKAQTQRHNKHKTEKKVVILGTDKKIHKRSTALERAVKYFTGGLKPVSRRQPHL